MTRAVERCPFCHDLVEAPLEEHTPYCEAYEKLRRNDPGLPKGVSPVFPSQSLEVERRPRRRPFTHKTLHPDLRLKKVSSADPEGGFGGHYQVFLGDTLLGEVYNATGLSWTAEYPSGVLGGSRWGHYTQRVDAIAALLPHPRKEEAPHE